MAAKLKTTVTLYPNANFYINSGRLCGQVCMIFYFFFGFSAFEVSQLPAFGVLGVKINKGVFLFRYEQKSDSSGIFSGP